MKRNPDLIVFQISNAEWYILREGESFKASNGETTSILMDSPGQCVDWVIEHCNDPNTGVVKLVDASDALEAPNHTSEQKGYPY